MKPLKRPVSKLDAELPFFAADTVAEPGRASANPVALAKISSRLICTVFCKLPMALVCWLNLCESLLSPALAS